MAKSRGYKTAEAESAAVLSMINARGKKIHLSFQRVVRKLSWEEGRKGGERRMRRRRSEGGGREEGRGGGRREEEGGRGREEEDIILDEVNWEKYLRKNKRKQYLDIRRKSIKSERRPNREEGEEGWTKGGEEEEEEEEQKEKGLAIGALALISNYNMKVRKKKDEKKEEKADFVYVNFCFGHFFCGIKYKFKVRFNSFSQVGDGTQVFYLFFLYSYVIYKF